MTFRALLFTDCNRGDSLHGGTGYQFQAASVNARPADEAAVQKYMVYVPSPYLMQRAAPITEYPGSFVYHPGKDFYGVASGRYLGKVSGDGRQGNHITHALLTDDVGDLEDPRPAQLFGAPFWVTDKQPDKSLVALEPPLEYDPAMGEDSLQEVARAVGGRGGDASAAEFLSAVVSAFEHAAGPGNVKAVLSCSDTLRTMQWVAIGTLLLPPDDAMRCSIRVYVPDPLSAVGRIVAVHPPSFRDPVDVTAFRDVSGIDLDGETTGAIEVTERARYWAARFLTDDVYNTVDAVKLAGDFDSSEPAARLAACVLTFGDPVRSAGEADLLVEALASCGPGLHEEYGADLVNAMVESPASTTAECFIAALRSERRFGASPLVDRLQRSALERAGADPSFGSALARLETGDDAGVWGWVDPAEVDAAADALRTFLDGCAPADLPEAYTLAGRAGVNVQVPLARASMENLARVWARNPDLTEQRHDWMHADEVTDLLIQQLNVDIAADEGLRADVDAGRWNWVLQLEWAVAGENPAVEYIARAALPHADADQRRWLIGMIAATGGPDAWTRLWPDAKPELEDALLWLRAEPRSGSDPLFIAAAVPGFDAAVRGGAVTGEMLGRIEAFDGAASGALTDRLRRTARDSIHLERLRQDVLRSARDHRIPQDGSLGKQLAEVPDPVLSARLDNVLAALVQYGQPWDLTAFLDGARSDTAGVLRSELDALAHADPVTAVEFGLHLVRNVRSKAVRRSAESFCDDWIDTASEADRAEVDRKLAEYVLEPWQELRDAHEKRSKSIAGKLRRFAQGDGRGRER